MVDGHDTCAGPHGSEKGEREIDGIGQGHGEWLAGLQAGTRQTGGYAFGALDQLMIGEGSPRLAFAKSGLVPELSCGAQHGITNGGGRILQRRPRAPENHWRDCTTEGLPRPRPALVGLYLR